MNCTEFEDRLHAQFGALRFEETPDLTGHAGHCPACRTVLEQFRLLSDSLDVWRDQVPDVDLTGAVVAALQSRKEFSPAPSESHHVVMPRREHADVTRPMESASRVGIVARPYSFPAWLPSRRRTLWLAAGSLVGVLFFAVALSGLLNEAPQNAVEPEVAKTPEPAGQESPLDAEQLVERVNAAAGPPQAMAAPAGEVYFDLAQKAAGALGEVTAYVMPGSSPPPSSPSAVEPEGAAGWINGVKHRLEPIGRSLDDAFDFLWEAGLSADGSKI